MDTGSATKHFFKNTDGLVLSALRGIVSTNPSLAVQESDKVLFDTKHDKSQVSLICGGGSGHEPHSAGFVGGGMLAAAVAGDVFASPNTYQIETACDLVPSSEGHIFIVTNYTGDMLHFGLAKEKLNAVGRKAGLVRAADDVSVGRKHGGLVGRRGLSGTILQHKILGGASLKHGFDQVLKLGHALTDSLVSINAGLDHCHIPGRNEEYGHLKANQCEIGLGIHNEPGVKLLEETPDADDLIKSMLNLLLDLNDEDRAFVKFDKNDKVVMLINNLGGVSIIEQHALTEHVRAQLESEWNITPSRVYSDHFMTSLNAPIFAVTLLNVTHCAKQAGLSEEEVFSFLDAPTKSCNWPNNHYSTNEPVKINTVETTSQPKPERGQDLQVDSETARTVLKQVADNIIKKEPDLTEWDTKMGDGDCGHTLENGAKALNKALDEGLGKNGSVLDILETILEITEVQMGGTLGAIFGIYFAAFTSSLKSHINDPSVFVSAAQEALTSLRKHTPASPGDRTVMDVLIPFVEKFGESNGDISQACDAAEKAAEGTKYIKPKLGRATYVGGLDELNVLPPDPGAWALYEIARGLASK